MRNAWSILLMWVTLPAVAQTDLIYPWIANNATFRGKLVINNLNTESVDIHLVAQREADSNDTLTQTVDLTLEALTQRVTNAGDLFTEMGEGSAYMVRLTSTSSNITGAFVNSGTSSQSGSSPSQTNVFQASEVADTWLFNYMFIEGGFSAPVILNLGGSSVDVSLFAYQNGEIAAETAVTIPAGTPKADTTANLFPELTGDLYVVAHAAGAELLGTAFIFNEFEFLEPAMANAQPLSMVPMPDTSSPISFSGQVQPIFTATCGGGSCHTNGGNQQGLRLDSGTAYSEIVNVNSTAVTSAVRIVPGDTDNSYLYNKLFSALPRPYVGSPMPLSSSPLTDSEKNIIRDWILQGALNN